MSDTAAISHHLVHRRDILVREMRKRKKAVTVTDWSMGVSMWTTKVPLRNTHPETFTTAPSLSTVTTELLDTSTVPT